MMRLTTLANGLRVATREMPSVETVSVGLFTDAGSRHETARENGLAHLFEHMVFKGAGGRSAREIAEVIEDVGGDLNAATGRDTTVFSARLLAEHLPLGVDVIADLIMRPHFEAKELEREKRVVLQELGEARDTPGDIVFDNLYAVAYPDQPLGRSILGDETSISGLTLDDLVAWKARHYVPSAMCLIAAGKVDHAAFVDSVSARFDDVSDASSRACDPARFSAGQNSDTRASEQAHLTLALAAPASRADDYFAARLFADAVGGGMSSRLFQELREERGLAYSVYAGLQPFDDTGMFYIYAATEPDQAGRALALMQSVLKDAVETLDAREFERARALVKAGLLMSLESAEGQAAYVARQLSLYGRLVEPAEVVAEIDAVSLCHVREAGAAMLAGPFASASVGASAAALAA